MAPASFAGILCKDGKKQLPNERTYKSNDDGAKTATLLWAFEGACADLPHRRTKKCLDNTSHANIGELAVKEKNLLSSNFRSSLSVRTSKMEGREGTAKKKERKRKEEKEG